MITIIQWILQKFELWTGNRLFRGKMASKKQVFFFPALKMNIMAKIVLKSVLTQVEYAFPV